MSNFAATRSAELDALLATRQDGHGLPRAFYHDAALYAAEMRTIWQGGWLFAGLEIELPQPGDFITLSVDGQRREYEDVFGNTVHLVNLETPWSELVIDARSLVN